LGATPPRQGAALTSGDELVMNVGGSLGPRNPLLRRAEALRGAQSAPGRSSGVRRLRSWAKRGAAG
jgi:hypothetical protein